MITFTNTIHPVMITSHVGQTLINSEKPITVIPCMINLISVDCNIDTYFDFSNANFALENKRVLNALIETIDPEIQGSITQFVEALQTAVNQFKNQPNFQQIVEDFFESKDAD